MKPITSYEQVESLKEKDVNYIVDADTLDYPKIKLRAYGLFRSRPATASDWEDVHPTATDAVDTFHTLTLSERQRLYHKFAREDRLAERELAMKKKKPKGATLKETNVEAATEHHRMTSEEYRQKKMLLLDQWYAKYVEGMRHGKNYWEFVNKLQNIEPRIQYGAKTRAKSARRRFVLRNMTVTLPEPYQANDESSAAEPIHQVGLTTARIDEIYHYLELKKLSHRSHTKQQVAEKSLQSWRRRKRVEQLHLERLEQQQAKQNSEREALRQKIKLLHFSTRKKAELNKAATQKIARPAASTGGSPRFRAHSRAASSFSNYSRRSNTHSNANNGNSSKSASNDELILEASEEPRESDSEFASEPAAQSAANTTSMASVSDAKTKMAKLNKLDSLLKKDVFTSVGGYKEVTEAFLEAHADEGSENLKSAHLRDDLDKKIEFDLAVNLKPYMTPAHINQRRDHVFALKVRSTKLAQETLFSEEPKPFSKTALGSLEQGEQSKAQTAKKPCKNKTAQRTCTEANENAYVMLPVTIVNADAQIHNSNKFKSLNEHIDTKRSKDIVPLSIGDVLASDSVRVMSTTYKATKKSWVPFLP